MRKQLLIAESEINRAHLIQELQRMSSGIVSLAGRVKTVGAVASAAGMLLAGLTAFRHGKCTATNPPRSWLQTAFAGARLLGSIWLANRPRR